MGKPTSFPVLSKSDSNNSSMTAARLQAWARWVLRAGIFSRSRSASQQVQAYAVLLLWKTQTAWLCVQTISTIFIFHTWMSALRQLASLYGWKITHTNVIDPCNGNMFMWDQLPFSLFQLSWSKMFLSTVHTGNREGTLIPKAKGEMVRVTYIKTEQSGHVCYDVSWWMA